MLYKNCIIEGDCFKLIKTLPDNEIDLIVTSPPYANTKSYGKIINVLHPDKYVEWIMPLFKEMMRVIKPSGSIIFNDVILDPFMGSGTTALAATELKRLWIGFEMNPVYVKMTQLRLPLTRKAVGNFFPITEKT